MQLDLADVKPSVQSFLVVGLMAVLFIALLKVVLRRWPVPGLADLVNSV
jgi:hypothetical protein